MRPGRRPVITRESRPPRKEPRDAVSVEATLDLQSERALPGGSVEIACAGR